jgi:hypothetical protein
MTPLRKDFRYELC